MKRAIVVLTWRVPSVSKCHLRVSFPSHVASEKEGVRAEESLFRPHWLVGTNDAEEEGGREVKAESGDKKGDEEEGKEKRHLPSPSISPPPPAPTPLAFLGMKKWATEEGIGGGGMKAARATLHEKMGERDMMNEMRRRGQTTSYF